MNEFQYFAIVAILAFCVLLALIFVSLFFEFQIRLFIRLDIIAEYILSEKYKRVLRGASKYRNEDKTKDGGEMCP